MPTAVDFERFIERLPDAYLLVRADAPRWTIASVSDAYLAATHKTRAAIVGHGTFDVFPESAETQHAAGEQNVRASFERAVKTGEPTLLPVQRYDLARSAEDGGGFEERYWQLGTQPVVDPQGKIAYVLHYVEDVTTREHSLRQREFAETRATDILQSMGDAYVALDENFRITYINTAAERITNTVAADVIGKTHAEQWPRSVGTAIERAYQRAMHERVAVHVEHHDDDPAGNDLWLDIDAFPVIDGGIGIFFRDVGERKRAAEALQHQALELELQAAELEQQNAESHTLREELELTNEELQIANTELEDSARTVQRTAERARRLLTVCAGLNQAASADQVADVILQEGMAAVGADAGSFALITVHDDTTAEFEVIRTTGFAEHLVQEFRRFPLTSGRPLSDAVIKKLPILVESRAAARDRYPTLTDVGYEGFAAVPVILGGRPIAAIGFSFREPQAFDDSSETFLLTLGEQCAQALERARLYDAHSHNATRTAFLADASRFLSSSLDYETTLASIAEAAVPTLGDWCAVDILEDPTAPVWPPQLSRVAVVHRDPAKKALGLSLQQRFPTDWSATTGMPAVLRDRSPQFIPIITDEMLVAGARNPEHLHILRELGFTSIIIAPLLARGLTLGSLTLVMSTPGRHFDQSDLTLAIDLASRAAIAIDNARLMRDAHDARLSAEHARTSAISANKAKSDFLATMSHEIRTPINAIMGYEELLELGLAGPLTDDQRLQLSRIRSSTQHLLGLVNEVLDLAKIESGTLHIESAQASAGDTVDMALSLIRPQAVAQGVTLSDQCEGARESVYVGDEHRVRQVLTNLLSNAVKFTESGGAITVSCLLTRDVPQKAGLMAGTQYIGFRVADTGIGIPSEQIDRIFEPFTQAEREGQTPYTRERNGTGLGLSISRQLAHLMHGEITVESTLAQGSTFTFWIPSRPE